MVSALERVHWLITLLDKRCWTKVKKLFGGDEYLRNDFFQTKSSLTYCKDLLITWLNPSIPFFSDTGDWTEWGSWETCTEDCPSNTSSTSRKKSCSQGERRFCVGQFIETQRCKCKSE